MISHIACALLLLVAASLALAAPPPSAVYALTLESHGGRSVGPQGAAGGGGLAVRVVTTPGAVSEGCVGGSRLTGHARVGRRPGSRR